MNGLSVIIGGGDIGSPATAPGLARKGVATIVLERFFVLLDQPDAVST